jgi:3'-phosphoadenosine 5'-phosphosulfate sulfotransferase (PAPS reductase)/FAD synthetase
MSYREENGEVVLTMSRERVVCHFSCGAASAVATKLMLAEFPSRVFIINAFIEEEHTDNRRFLADCERWFGCRVKVLRDEKFRASTHEVWRRKRYMKGLRGAPCSKALKRDLLDSLAHPEDINVLGFTAEEEDRAIDLQQFAPDRHWKFPLIERGLGKDDCKAMVERAGIELPLMYRLGYENANCIGCPKGGQAYWQNIRADFPEQFVQIKTIQEQIGEGAYFLRFRSGPREKERMSLADLPPGRGDMRTESSFSCSFFCDLAEREY